MRLKKVLLIEDDSVIVDLLRCRLEDGGFKVISAGNGQIGLQKMKKDNPDLVLLDVKMPGMDGFEVCRIAKNDPELKEIPIVFLTTAAQEWDLKEAKEAGAEGYITKPYEGKGIVEKIEEILNRKEI